MWKSWEEAVASDKAPVEKRLIKKLGSGESIYRQGRLLVVDLPDTRDTLATTWLGGGYRDDLKTVFNSQVYEGTHDLMKTGDFTKYIRTIAEKIGLDPNRCCGLSTAANMDNAGIVSRAFRSTGVTAIITAGVEGNGGRAGDPASYNEATGFEKVGGTIVTMLVIDADIPKHTMARAIMTASEAKACALQELMAPSLYSNGIATGSGTDQIAIICNPNSSNHITDAGKHSKLGELIGKNVIEATKIALEKQNGLNAAYQCDALRRLKRYKFTENDCWISVKSSWRTKDSADFSRKLKAISKSPEMVALVSSIIHINDEIDWGMIPEKEGKRIGLALIQRMPEILTIDGSAPASIKIHSSKTLMDNLVGGISQMVRPDEAPLKKSRTQSKTKSKGEKQ